MPDYKSLIDPNHKLFVNEKYWVIAILRNPKKDPNHAFLIIEGINSEGKLALTRYDCLRDSDHEDKFRINVDRRVVDPKDGQKSCLNLLNNQETVGKAWFIKNSDAVNLMARIEKSKENPGNYNKLGNNAIFPRLFETIRAVPGDKKQWTQEAIANALAARTGAYMVPEAATLQPAAFTVYLTSPEEVKEAMADANEGDYTQNVYGPLDNNSFTWARNMLYSINNNAIIRDLPEKPLDLKASLVGCHLKSNGSDYPYYYGIDLQLKAFQQEIDLCSGNQNSNQNMKYDNVISHLKNLKKKLASEPRDNPAVPFLLELFTDFTNSLNTIHDEQMLLDRVQLLSDRLDEKANEFKLHEPMNAKLKAAIFGTIGAIVGLVTGAVVGAIITSWSGGFGALPGAIIGAAKGITLGTTLGLSGGGIGCFVGTLFGFHNAKKKQQDYEKNIKSFELIEASKKEVDAIKNDRNISIKNLK